MSQVPSQNLDQLVAANRRATPIAALERRAKPRLSIGELNQMDIDELRDKYLNSKYDARTPVQQVLDIVDLPRNVVANALFRGTAREKEQQREFGTFGLPKVNFSDALGSLGVENRVAKGILGFVGDVALDPLTYLGPAGWGAKVGNVALRSGGKRALNRAIKEAAERGVSGVADRTAADLLRAAGVTDELRDAGEISKRVFGDFSNSKVERAFSFLGGERTSEGGIFRKYAEMAKTGENVAEHGNIDAVRSFVDKYVRGTGGGIKIGTGGSEVAHLPFTDVTLQVPAFTPTGKATVRAFQIAKDKSVAELSGAITDAHSTLEAARAEQAAFATARDDYILKRTDLENRLKTGSDPAIETELRNLDAQYAKNAEAVQQSIKAKADSIRNAMETNAVDPISGLPKPLSPNDVLAYREKLLETQALAGMMRMEAERFKRAATARTQINADIQKSIDDASRVVNRLAQAQETRTGGFRNEFLGFDPSTSKAVINADPMEQARAFEAARPILDQIEEKNRELVALNRGATGMEDDLVKQQHGLFVASERQSVDEINRIQQLTNELATLRQQLVQATEPLRTGQAFTTLDDFANGLRERSIAALDDKSRSLFDLADKDPVGATALANTYSELSDAVLNYRGIVGGTLAAHLSPDHREIIEMVKHGLGTSDDVVAMSTVAQMAAAFNNASGHDPSAATMFFRALDRKLAPIFGSRHGEMATLLSNIRAAYGKNANVIGAQMFETIVGDMQKAMRVAGLSLADDTINEVMELATLTAHQLVDPNGTRIATRVVDDAGNLIDSSGIKALHKLLATLSEKIPDPTKRAEFIQSVKQIVQGGLDQIKALGDDEVAEFILDQMIPGYVPHVLSPQAQASKQVTSRLRAMQRDGGRGVKEGFQKHRVTQMHIFPDIRPGREGKFEQFFTGDRAVMDLSDAQVEEMARFDPQRAKSVQEMRERIARYDSLPVKPQPLQADVHTLNEAAQSGRFSPFAMEPGVDLFDTRWPMIIAHRTASHERAMATQDLISIIANTSLNIDAKTLKDIGSRVAQSGIHKDITLPNGEVVRVGPTSGRSGRQTVAVYARGQAYRTLDPALAAHNDNPVAKYFADTMDNLVVPEAVANSVEDIAKVWRDDNAATLFSAIEKMTNVFKSVVLLHPSWFVNDLIGGVTLLARGDHNIGKVASMLKDAAKIRRFRNNPEQLAKITVNIGGQTMTGLDLARIASEQRVFEQHKIGEVIAMMAGNDLQPSRFKKMPFREAFSSDAQWRMNRMLDAMGKSGGARATARIGGYVGTGADRLKRYVLHPWASANAMMNDSLRMAAMMSMMDDGHDVAAAADKLRRSMYDFQDLTNVERKYLRTIFPFYTWMRNNLSYQIRQFFKQPSFVASFPKLQQALEESLAGEQRIPMALRPAWMRQELAVQIGNDPNGRFAFLLGQSIPALDALKVLQAGTGVEGVMETAKFFGSSMTPGLTIPMQLAAGKEIFSGREIGPELGKGDVTAGEFLAGHVRPVAEFGPGGRFAKTLRDQGLGPAIARGIVGGRVQAFDDDRIVTSKARELRDSSEGYRRAITKAERNGDKKTSVKARARLLKVYEEAIALGLDKEVNVPKWARQTLEQLANTN